MIVNDINQVNVAVYDKVREYYKVDKYLGGLISVFTSVFKDRMGREVQIFVPQLQREDEIYINGVKYAPSKETNT